MAKGSENRGVRKVQPQDPIKSVKPIVSPEDKGSETPAPTGGRSNGTIFGKMRDFLSQAVNSVSGAAIGGFRGLKNSWFGIKPVSKGISNGVGKAADFMNVSKRLMSVILAVTLLGGVGAGTIAFVNNQQTNLILRQEDYSDECGEELDAAKKAFAQTLAGDPNAAQQENAEKMWALGKALGMTDEQCAGMIGNMMQESGLDPTSVEAIFSEPYQIGPRKSVLFNGNDITPAMSMWTSQLPGIYASSGITINIDAYRFSDGRLCAGLGLIGFTGPLAEELLNFAEANGKQWYDLDLQVAAIIGGSDASRARLQSFIGDTGNAGSVYGGTGSWMGIMERGLGHAQFSGTQFEQRLQNAEDWYARLSPNSSSIAAKWKDFANSVIEMAQASVAAATGRHAQEMEEECQQVEPAPDNGTLADAAVAYAYENYDLGRGNDGTQLYRAVHDAMYPGDPWYQSCDRGVACAVVWSGADDDFPAGATGTQLNYMRSHPEKWKELGPLSSCVDSLEPGDILITDPDGHIVMYVGNEAVRKKYPNSDATIVSASLNTRSPGCGNEGPNYYVTGDGRFYVAFRYVGNYDGQKKNLYTGGASGTN